jgi:sugar O-acyltransferase (sialic acid O-acetyltransferase NeuD family)
MENKIVIIGGGGHAKVLISLIKKTPCYRILGYTDVSNKGTILKTEYIGNDSVLKSIIKEHRDCSAALGIGIIGRANSRMQIFTELKNTGFLIPAIISPDAVINEEVEIGEGSVVFDGVVVNSGARIYKACILNTNSTVEHDCRIGDNSHVAPGSALSGSVCIGKDCLIGTGASIIQGIKICDGCKIAAGSVIIKDCKIPGMYAGNPASLKKRL